MLKTLMGLAATAALVVPATAMADQSFDCGNGRSISLTGANTLWPPNHKYHDYTVTATGNSLDTDANLMSMVTSNEPDVGLGSGGPQHANDANPPAAMDEEMTSNTASVFHQLRSERSGRGSGRTYTFTEHATWDMGAFSCDATFKVFVPHDMGHRA